MLFVGRRLEILVSLALQRKPFKPFGPGWLELLFPNLMHPRAELVPHDHDHAAGQF